ncbi:MAG: class I SAM-dependent methyltransferase [Desulfotomaculum sp.]|nr:class I SAM-dependent methyltransferase [Desulfotomaculum sp.]MCL0080702.1 class I SAM-dependent methyltransferase [Peptococcaceae bacterium]
MQHLVTTSLKTTTETIKTAKQIAAELDILYESRAGRSLADLETTYGSSGILVVAKSKLTIYIQGQAFFFHPGMAKLRIKALKNGIADQMIKAMDLSRGDSVLDCTLGLGSDAVVANYVAGQPGLITGIESNVLMAYVVKAGLAAYQNSSRVLVQAVRGIKVINAEHYQYLSSLPANSVDVVYFDPMFRQPLNKSAGILPLRKLANYSPLATEIIQAACRVAKKRVVIKEKTGSDEFNRLGFSEVVGGKKSPVAYGIIKKNINRLLLKK